MPNESNRSHEAKEESHASPMDDTGDEFVSNIDEFDILMGSGVDEETPIERLRR
ncbi:hypothetical protein J1N35_005593, partial [Gossypium stocksii]